MSVAILVSNNELGPFPVGQPLPDDAIASNNVTIAVSARNIGERVAKKGEWATAASHQCQ